MVRRRRRLVLETLEVRNLLTSDLDLLPEVPWDPNAPGFVEPPEEILSADDVYPQWSQRDVTIDLVDDSEEPFIHVGSIDADSNESTVVVAQPAWVAMLANRNFELNSSSSIGPIGGGGNGGGPPGSGGTGTVTPITIWVEGTPVGPEGSTQTFVVRASSALSQDVTVSFVYAGVSLNPATAGSDYTPTASVRLPAGYTSYPLLVPYRTDLLSEPTESFQVTVSALSVSSAIAVIGTQSGQGAITNVAVGGGPVTIWTDTMMSGQEGSSHTLVVKASRPLTQSVTATIAYALGSPGAVRGTDFTGSTTVTIPVSNSFASIPIEFLVDNINEPTEYFHARVVSVNVVPSVAVADSNSIAIGTILNGTTPSSVRQIAIADAWGIEGVNGSLTFRVTASNAGPSAATVSVAYATRNASAIAPADYLSRSGSISFAPTESEKFITVPIVDDSIVETTEFFLISLSNPSPSSRAVLADPDAIGSIIDNDSAINLFVDPAPAVREGNPSQFRVWVDNPVRNVSGTLRTASGSATEDIDYDGGDYPFTLPVGTSVTTVAVPTYVNNDPPEAPREDYFANAINVINATVKQGQGRGEIIESTPRIQIGQGSTRREGDTIPSEFWVLVSVPSDFENDIYVNYGTQDGTAIAWADYKPVSGSILFRKGVPQPLTNSDYQRFIIVETVPDLIPETPRIENFFLNFFGPIGGTLSSDPQAVELKIQDDDTLPTLTITGGRDKEGLPIPFLLTFDRDPPPGAAVTLKTYDGSAKVSTGDYTPYPSNGITVGLPFRTNTVTVQSLNDAVVESDENFLLEASNPVGVFEFVGGGPTASASGTIVDETTLVKLTISDGAKREGNLGYSPAELLDFTISLTVTGKPLTVPVTVNYSTLPMTGSNRSRYATPIVDYQPVSGSVTISPGQSSAIFSVPLNGDLLIENDEQFYGRITGVTFGSSSTPPTGVYSTMVRSLGVGTIIDDDLLVASNYAFDFVRQYDEKVSCVCDSAPAPVGTLVSNVDGALTHSPEFEPMLVMRKGGNFDSLQLQTLTVTRGEESSVPDQYVIAFEVGTRRLSTHVLQAIAGDAARKSSYTVPLDLSEFSTGIYDGIITMSARKLREDNSYITYNVEKRFQFKVIDNERSEYTPYWWNPLVERLYPLKRYGEGNLATPNFNNGALYVRGDQTAWWYEAFGGVYQSPNGNFDKLTKLSNGEFELKAKTGERKIFSSGGLLVRQMDRNGNITQYSYTDADSDGVTDELASVSTPLAQSTIFSYSGGFLSQIVDSVGRVTNYTVVDKKLVRIDYADPDGTGPRANPFYTFVYQFGTNGGFITSTSADNDVSKFTFNKNGRVTSIEEPNGAIWQYDYLKDQQSVISLPGGPMEVGVIPGAMEAITTDPRGNKTYISTDRFGNPTKIKYPGGAVETITRNQHGLPISHSYPSAAGGLSEDIYTYDGLYNVTSLNSPYVGVANWVYDSVNSLPIIYSQTNQPGISLTRDVFGNVISVTTNTYSDAIAANPSNSVPNPSRHTNPLDRFDVNNDGLVNGSDSLLMLQYVNGGFQDPTLGVDDRPLYLDVTGDGAFNILDKEAIDQYLAVPRRRMETYSYTTSADGLPAGLVKSYTNAAGEQYVVDYYGTGNNYGMFRRVGRVINGVTTYLQTVGYDANRNLAYVSDMYNRQSNYTFDRLGMLTKVRGVANFSLAGTRPETNYTYSTMGKLTSILDPANQLTTISHYVQARAITVTYSSPTQGSRTYQSAFDTMGNVTAEIDPLNRMTNYDYDARNRLTSISYPALVPNTPQSFVQYVYNAAGYPTQYKDIFGTITHAEYAASGDLVSTSIPNVPGLGTVSQYWDYQSPGVVRSYVDADQVMWMVDYDGFGQLAAMRSLNNGVNNRPTRQTFAYDKLGRQLGGTDASGAYQLTQLDDLGRVKSMSWMPANRSPFTVMPELQISEPTLNSIGGFDQQVILPDGRTMSIGSDARDRVHTVTYPGLNGIGNVSESYQYDILDRLYRSVDTNGATTQYSFNRFGEVTQVQTADPSTGDASSAFAYSYAYDDAGRLVETTLPNGAKSTYQYDKWDRIKTVTSPDADGTGPLLPFVSNWNYNLSTRKVTRTDSDGNSDEQTFDQLGRLATHKGGDGGITSFAYTAGGKLLDLTDPLGNKTSWTYDIFGKALTETQSGIGMRQWEYSSNGNLKKYTDRAGAVATWTYNLGSQPLTESWAAHNGNAAKSITYEYDTLSRLKKVSEDADHFVQWAYNQAGLVTNETTQMPNNMGAMVSPSGITSSIDYAYDTHGRNTSKQLKVGGVTQYTDTQSYDKRNRLVSTSRSASGNGSLWSSFEYNTLDNIVGTQRGTGTSVGSSTDLQQVITRDLAGRPTQIDYRLPNNTSIETYWRVPVC
jgi:YD repeat-containing protein